MRKLLNDTEAAIKIGITKELLYAYVRNAPKKHLGHDRKLISEVIDGKNYFSEDELNKFNSYLMEPWSNAKDGRPEIPKYIQEYLKTEIGGKCPISGKGYPLDNAHIISYSESINHHHHNLIRIAKEEHTKADNGVIPRELLKNVKGQLIESLRNKLKLENGEYRSSFRPPNPHSLFVGRIDKLIELTDSMEFDRLIIIEGLGGIGKTELLLNALNNVKYHNPVLWLDVETISSVNDLVIILNNLLFQITEKPIIGSFVETLREIRITLVFDSLEKLLLSQRDETEEFIKVLITQTNETQIIITSQVDLSIIDHSKKIIELKGIDSEESILLIKKLLSNDLEISEDNLTWILNFCNGHPLSIKLVVSLLRFYKSQDEVVKQLKKNGSLKRPMREKHDKSSALDVCLSTIYNSLTNDQEEILQYTKFFPGGVKLQWAEEHFNTKDLTRHISVLRQFFFVEVRRDQLDFERIIIPNPIHPFLREKAFGKLDDSELALQKEALKNIMMEAVIVDWHYFESAKESGSLAYGIRRIEDEMPNILEAFRIAQNSAEINKINGNEKLTEEYLQIVSGIASSLGKFCFIRGYFEYGLVFSKAGIDANISLNRIEIASSHYMYLAQIQARQMDFEGFSKTVDDLMTLALKTENMEAKINAAWAKGRLEFDQYHFDEALCFYQEALKLLGDLQKKENNAECIVETKYDKFKEHACTSTIGNIAIIKFEIAKVYEFTGNFLEAIKHHEYLINILTHTVDESNLMSNYHHYAHCLCKVGRFDDGLKYYFKAIEGFKEIGQFEYMVNSISDLGIFLEDFPTVVNSPLLEEDTFSLAFENLSHQLLDFINRESLKTDFSTALDNIPIKLLNKILWLIKLVSLSPHCFELTNWVMDITETIDIQWVKPNYIKAIFNLAHSVGGVSYWKDDSESKEKVIKAILQSCLIINGGPDLESQTRIFYWLAIWMQHSKLDIKADAESLWQQAWESFDK